MKNTVYTKKSKSGIRRKADIIVSALIGISVYLFNVTPIPDNLPLSNNAWKWSGNIIIVFFWLLISFYVIPKLLKRLKSGK